MRRPGKEGRESAGLRKGDRLMVLFIDCSVGWLTDAFWNRNNKERGHVLCVCVSVGRSVDTCNLPRRRGRGRGRGDVADVKLSRRSFYICVIVVLEDL